MPKGPKGEKRLEGGDDLGLLLELGFHVVERLDVPDLELQGLRPGVPHDQ